MTSTTPSPVPAEAAKAEVDDEKPGCESDLPEDDTALVNDSKDEAKAE